VIQADTTGFLWWGTKESLRSHTITRIEIPAALERARAGGYPVIPVFVDLDPATDRGELVRGLKDAAELIDLNGVLRCEGEESGALARRVAKRFLTDAWKASSPRESSALFRTMSAPHQDADVAFDWRALFDEEARRVAPDGLSLILTALDTFRTALQEREHSSDLEIDSDLPLPLAYLVGYQLRQPTRIRLSVSQRTGLSFKRIALEGSFGPVPEVARRDLGGSGPTVLGVSCNAGFAGAAHRYAETVGANELRVLHIEGTLGPAKLRGLAHAASAELRVLRDRGVEKHLLIFGPGALALGIGTLSNAVGPVVLPFWHNASMSYVNPILVGGDGSAARGAANPGSVVVT
jgi:hypothetical protein